MEEKEIQIQYNGKEILLTFGDAHPHTVKIPLHRFSSKCYCCGSTHNNQLGVQQLLSILHERHSTTISQQKVSTPAAPTQWNLDRNRIKYVGKKRPFSPEADLEISDWLETQKDPLL